MRLSLLLLIAVPACAAAVGPSSSSRGAAGTLSDVSAGGAIPGPEVPAARLPTMPGVAAYGAAAAAQQLRGLVRPDALRAKLIEEIRRVAAAARRPAPVADIRLDAVAQDLAVGLRGAQLPPFETVDFLLGHYGMVEPAPNFLLARASSDADQEVTSQMGVQIAELCKTSWMTSRIAQVGVGVHRTPAGEMAVVVALQEKNVVLGAVPRRVNPGDEIPIAGQLLGTHRRPEVIVTTPDGHARELPISIDATGVSFRADVRCNQGRGRYQVEVTGVDALGTAVVANFPVFCGVAPPVQPPAALPARAQPWSAAESEARLLDLVNRDRRAASLPPVALDQALSVVARAHSQDMADHGFVGHVSPTTGNALDRVRRGGFRPALLLENVGRAYSPDEVEAGLMQSPGHRANILYRGVTRIGIGVVVGKEVTGTSPLLVTQLFM